MGRVRGIQIVPTYRSNGYSRIIDTSSYAIVTNVCVNTKDEFFTLHLQDDRVLSNLLTKYNRKDFYSTLLLSSPHSQDNIIRVLKTPLHPSKLHSTPLKLAVIHPSSFSQSYDFLEGTSLLSYIALHPHHFPKVFERTGGLYSFTYRSFLTFHLISME